MKAKTFCSITDLSQARVWRNADIVRIETDALEKGLPLMRRAGQAAAELALWSYPKIGRVAIVAGSGNNGGDAWVCACILRQHGIAISIAYARPPRSPEARQARQDYLEATSPGEPDASSVEELCQLDCLDGVDLIVDGLLGTGVSGAVNEECARVINAINASTAPVLALDLPSGLHPDSGQASLSVRASVTISFLALKNALFSTEAAPTIGRVYFSDLALGEEFYRGVPHWYRLANKRPQLFRPADSHKGDYGSVWIYGGQGSSAGASMAGAVLLAARAAVRCGCGLVRVFSHSDHIDHLATSLNDAIYHDALGVEPPGRSRPSSVCVLGPGLGQSQWSHSVFDRASHWPGCSVIDADGLNILAERQIQAQGQWVLTPHPKEAARLLQVDVDIINEDRFAATRALAQRYRCVAVLKGYGTLVSDGEELYMCPFGNPAMACAGMGDVLSGVIGALMAQGRSPIDAAVEGVALHACTGDQLKATMGWSVSATDLADAVRLHDPAE